MKNKILKVLLLALLLLPIKNVEALDTLKMGSIDVTYQYDEKLFANSNISLYKIANLNEDGVLTYEEAFKGNQELNGLTTSEWSKLAEDLSEFAEENQINYYKQELTNQEGKVSFQNLPVGLYLIKVEEVERNGYKYSSLPVLISLPNFDEVINDYLYEMNIITKTEEKKIEPVTPPVDDNKPNTGNTGSNIKVPYTFDAIMIYAIIAVASLTAIIVLVYFISRSKKGKEENEEENQQ